MAVGWQDIDLLTSKAIMKSVAKRRQELAARELYPNSTTRPPPRWRKRLSTWGSRSEAGKSFKNQGRRGGSKERFDLARHRELQERVQRVGLRGSQGLRRPTHGHARPT
jgi:hypothetical protein